MLPHYANMDNETFLDKIRDSVTGEQLKEGFRPELYDPTKGGGVLGRGVPGVVWHCLDVRYDQCIGNGACRVVCVTASGASGDSDSGSKLGALFFPFPGLRRSLRMLWRAWPGHPGPLLLRTFQLHAGKCRVQWRRAHASARWPRAGAGGAGPGWRCQCGQAGH